MTQGDIETYGPYPYATAGASLQTDSSNGINPDADVIIATHAGNSMVFYTVVKNT